jgi:hypothetical protein
MLEFYNDIDEVSDESDDTSSEETTDESIANLMLRHGVADTGQCLAHAKMHEGRIFVNGHALAFGSLSDLNSLENYLQTSGIVNERLRKHILDYFHVAGFDSLLSWLVPHLENDRKIVVMPDYASVYEFNSLDDNRIVLRAHFKLKLKHTIDISNRSSVYNIPARQTEDTPPSSFSLQRTLSLTPGKATSHTSLNSPLVSPIARSANQRILSDELNFTYSINIYDQDQAIKYSNPKLLAPQEHLDLLRQFEQEYLQHYVTSDSKSHGNYTLTKITKLGEAYVEAFAHYKHYLAHNELNTLFSLIYELSHIVAGQDYFDLLENITNIKQEIGELTRNSQAAYKDGDARTAAKIDQDIDILKADPAYALLAKIYAACIAYITHFKADGGWSNISKYLDANHDMQRWLNLMLVSSVVADLRTITQQDLSLPLLPHQLFELLEYAFKQDEYDSIFGPEQETALTVLCATIIDVRNYRANLILELCQETNELRAIQALREIVVEFCQLEPNDLGDEELIEQLYWQITQNLTEQQLTALEAFIHRFKAPNEDRLIKCLRQSFVKSLENIMRVDVLKKASEILIDLKKQVKDQNTKGNLNACFNAINKLSLEVTTQLENVLKASQASFKATELSHEQLATISKTNMTHSALGLAKRYQVSSDSLLDKVQGQVDQIRQELKLNKLNNLQYKLNKLTETATAKINGLITPLNTIGFFDDARSLHIKKCKVNVLRRLQQNIETLTAEKISALKQTDMVDFEPEQEYAEVFKEVDALFQDTLNYSGINQHKKIPQELLTSCYGLFNANETSAGYKPSPYSFYSLFVQTKTHKKLTQVKEELNTEFAPG